MASRSQANSFGKFALSWMFLLLAGLLEVAFTTALRLSEGLSKPLPTAIFVACAVFSFLSLEKAARAIPLGTAYAVWVGIGAAGTLLVGVALFEEPLSAPRLLFLALLLSSIIGLRLCAPD
jgi:quaternary ammonium compound-resistance protein SugE